MKLFGETTLELAFDGFHTSQEVVVGNLRERGLILGLDFLREHECEMSIRDGTLKIGPATLASTKHGRQDTVARVRLEQSCCHWKS